MLDHEAAFPDGCLAGAKALLLYAMLPYDLSFFGMMRQPSLFAVNLVFLFPLFGADSVCVITLWLALYKYDEYQLTDFIIKSKGLAFITAGAPRPARTPRAFAHTRSAPPPLGPRAGVITGVLGFVKLEAHVEDEAVQDALLDLGPHGEKDAVDHPVHPRRHGGIVQRDEHGGAWRGG